ncbi:MAG: NADPH-dependent F420 reductase [Actinobacteria bacterium]|nr:NADPH-dependent F420 reductase [Actinomycetota bacterium]
MTDPRSLTVAVLGGTGDQGQGLAFRFARAGVRVVIGSRDGARAAASAAELAERVERAGPASGSASGSAGGSASNSASDSARGSVTGRANAEAAAEADVVIIAVPWSAHQPTIAELVEPLRGKIVVDCVNPLAFDERGPSRIDVPEGSAAEQAAQLLPESRVVGAFHNVSAVTLSDPAVDDLDQDVLVLGDDREATDVVRALADLLPGVRGIFAGRLRNSAQVEALTANLIAINRRYKTHAGIKISGV